MKFKFGDKDVYMDGILEQNLGSLKKSVKKDWDCVILIDGPEGAGKSVLAQQVAGYLDPTFCTARMTLGIKEFEEAIHKAKKFECVVGDEMLKILNSKSAMSSLNKRIVELLAEVRQKNLFIVLVLPTFFDMDKYAALWRSVALIHVYVGKDLERGYFSFYDYLRKKNLYLNGKKMYDYNKVRPNFYGRFTNRYVLKEDEYRQKKLVNLRRDKKKDIPPQTLAAMERRADWFEILFTEVRKKRIWTQEQLAKMFGVHISTVERANTFKKRLMRGDVGDLSPSKPESNLLELEKVSAQKIPLSIEPKVNK